MLSDPHRTVRWTTLPLPTIVCLLSLIGISENQGWGRGSKLKAGIAGTLLLIQSGTQGLPSERPKDNPLIMPIIRFPEGSKFDAGAWEDVSDSGYLAELFKIGIAVSKKEIPIDQASELLNQVAKAFEGENPGSVEGWEHSLLFKTRWENLTKEKTSNIRSVSRIQFKQGQIHTSKHTVEMPGFHTKQILRSRENILVVKSSDNSVGSALQNFTFITQSSGEAPILRSYTLFHGADGDTLMDNKSGTVFGREN